VWRVICLVCVVCGVWCAVAAYAPWFVFCGVCVCVCVCMCVCVYDLFGVRGL